MVWCTGGGCRFTVAVVIHYPTYQRTGLPLEDFMWMGFIHKLMVSHNWILMDCRCIVGSCWFVGSVWPTIALGPQNLAQRKEKSTEMIHQQHAETIVKYLFAPQKHQKNQKSRHLSTTICEQCLMHHYRVHMYYLARPPPL